MNYYAFWRSSENLFEVILIFPFILAWRLFYYLLTFSMMRFYEGLIWKNIKKIKCNAPNKIPQFLKIQLSKENNFYE